MWRLCGPNLGTASCILRIFHTPQLSTAAYVSLTPEWINTQIFSASFAWLGPAWTLSYLTVAYQHLTLTVSNTEQYSSAVKKHFWPPTKTWHKTYKKLNMFWLTHFFHHTVREGGEGRAEMVVRVETADHSWIWLYMVLQLETGENPIVSNNYIIR